MSALVYMPKKCVISNCRCKYDKKSHLGYTLFKQNLVFIHMKCPKCNYLAKIVQPMALSHMYYENLPDDLLIESKIEPKDLIDLEVAMSNDEDFLSNLISGQ